MPPKSVLGDRSQRLKSPDELLATMNIVPPAPTEYYVLGFIHVAGARGPTIPMKVFVTNDLAATKATWQEANPTPLKFYAAVQCLCGDASVVLATWNHIFGKDMMAKAPGWYNVTKENVDGFIKSVTANNMFISVGEGRAKKPVEKVAKLPRKPAEAPPVETVVDAAPVEN